jgi:xylan 1,4-beta-xylosidase
MTNEYDNTYEKAGKLDDLWRLFNKIALEVKRVDSKAKVGGPALTWPKQIWLDGFLKNCGQNIDFLTWHNYASGDIYDPNELVFEKAGTIAGMAKDAMNAVKKHIPNRNIETFLTEYNIKWVWDPIELRHGNNVGAAFHASTLRQLAEVGISGAFVWHLKGHSYGIIEGDNSPRQPYDLFRWGPKYLVGNMPKNTTGDNKKLLLFPVVRPDGSRSLLLINTANQRVTIPGGASLFPSQGKTVKIERIASDGNKVLDTKEFATGNWTLPGYSVTLLTTAK